MNTKHYWLRGGIVGLVIAGILITYKAYSWCGVLIDGEGVCTVNEFVKSLTSEFNQYNWYENFLGTLMYVVVGSILGYVYGKFKNRKRVI